MGVSRYGQVVQVVGPVVVHTTPPVTVFRYEFFTNAVVASNPNELGDVCRIWYTVGSPVTGCVLKFAHAVPLVAMKLPSAMYGASKNTPPNGGDATDHAL